MKKTLAAIALAATMIGCSKPVEDDTSQTAKESAVEEIEETYWEKKFYVENKTPFGKYLIQAEYIDLLDENGNRKGYTCHGEYLYLEDKLNTEFKDKYISRQRYDLRLLWIFADCEGKVNGVTSADLENYPADSKKTQSLRCSTLKTDIDPQCTEEELKAAQSLFDKAKKETNYHRYKEQFEQSLKGEKETLVERIKNYM